ncbi:MAG: hypothetical protein ACC645_24660 [Pirellulales bacterium]
MSSTNGQSLQRFGFTCDKGGTHLARTMMLDDLATLLENGRIEQPLDTLRIAIEKDNILGKRSAQSRQLAARWL